MKNYIKIYTRFLIFNIESRESKYISYVQFFNNIINRKMGIQNSKGSSIIDANYLKSLSLSTPLKKTQQDQTEVHQIICLSHQHQQIMLQKIRIKKNYDCPYIIKIIDSHTLQSKSLCSTIIKTYIVVEKPQSLADQITQRIQLKMGFQQAEIWTLIYSCCVGASYLLKNNVGLTRLTSSKIFIDIKGGIKIIDPDFSQGTLQSQRINQDQYIQDLSQISKQLLKNKNNYSDYLIELIDLMSYSNNKLTSIESWIKNKYLDKKKQSGTIQIFSSAKKSKKNSKSKNKKMIKVTSNKKNENTSVNTFNSHQTSQIGQLSNFQSFSSYRCDKENKEIYTNSGVHRSRNNMDLFTFKDPLKDLQNINKQMRISSHLFPRKALFGGKSKNNQNLRETVSHQNTNQYKQQFLSPIFSHENIQSSFQQSHKQVLTRQSNSMILETDPSLDQNQIMNMISYQVDQQTFVREICQEQSYYFLQLMNQCKNSAKSSRT